VEVGGVEAVEEDGAEAAEEDGAEVGAVDEASDDGTKTLLVVSFHDPQPEA
jgi:hypothetical protein